MPAQLNHLIVHARDSRVAASFLSNLLGLPEPGRFGHFLTVQMANGATLDFIDSQDQIEAQHYAFLLSEAEFDESFERLRRLGLTYWADPARKQPGEINHHDGGRGVYFEDPSGHFLEIITRPYGSGG
jgi:catechol 2,3-dioxygenase-like lactoylglutathione lyase family enzyme